MLVQISDPVFSDSVFIGGHLFVLRMFDKFKDRLEARVAYIEVSQSAEPKGNFEWTDTLVLVKEDGRWLVWDIHMGCGWPFRMGPALRVMLNGI